MHSNKINLLFRYKYQLISTLQENKNLGEVIYPQTIDNYIKANSYDEILKLSKT